MWLGWDREALEVPATAWWCGFGLPPPLAEVCDDRMGTVVLQLACACALPSSPLFSEYFCLLGPADWGGLPGAPFRLFIRTHVVFGDAP